ncbi:MAG: hypothetical protein IJ524_04940 [Bacteroidales bacterium]|nr:hypothetical protein [Bacteroidales bacterium]
MKKTTRLATLLTAAMLTLTACEPENHFPNGGTPTPSTAELLVGRWQQESMDGQSLPSYLVAIDEYRADGMFVSSVKNTSTGVYFADSTGYSVQGDSILYDEPTWGSDVIILLDSLRLEKEVYVSDYNTTSVYKYVRL